MVKEVDTDQHNEPHASAEAEHVVKNHDPEKINVEEVGREKTVVSAHET